MGFSVRIEAPQGWIFIKNSEIKYRVIFCYPGILTSFILSSWCTFLSENFFVVKIQNICNLTGWSRVHISDIFDYYRANINEMWNARKLGGIYKTLEPYICKYMVNQHLVLLYLYSVSINKILVTEFTTVRVSHNLNLMWNISTHWNQQLIKYVSSKLIEFSEQNFRK